MGESTAIYQLWVSSLDSFCRIAHFVVTSSTRDCVLTLPLSITVIYLVTTAVAARATSIGVFIGLRIGQALGSSAVLALGAGSLADIYDVSALRPCDLDRADEVVRRNRLTSEGQNWESSTRERPYLITPFLLWGGY